MKFFDINLRGDHYSKELIEELLGYATVFKINDEELLLMRDMFDIRGTSAKTHATGSWTSSTSTT